MSKNRLSVLPAELSQLHKLKKLSLAGNLLTDSELGVLAKLPSLEYFTLHGNPLSKPADSALDSRESIVSYFKSQ